MNFKTPPPPRAVNVPLKSTSPVLHTAIMLGIMLHTMKYVNVVCVSVAAVGVPSDVFQSYFMITMAVI
jgi:hypothetical protein